ncbi:MAG: hypothetical protein H6660_13975 [Ardenticatenaceae bacterium]|nr:hypothetical protein [Ardenticatenaceae bacterium]
MVGGDKVGGDKVAGNKFVITNPTTYKYLSRKGVAFVLVVIAVIAAGAVLFSKMLPDTISLFPTPAPFDPVAEGEALIVVLPFHLTTDVSSDAHHKIYARIQASIDALGLTDVRVEIDPNADLHELDREEAQALGERHGAAVIIWGTETRSDITVKFLNLKELTASAGDEQVQIIDPDEYAEFVVKDLPGQLAFFVIVCSGAGGGG